MPLQTRDVLDTLSYAQVARGNLGNRELAALIKATGTTWSKAADGTAATATSETLVSVLPGASSLAIVGAGYVPGATLTADDTNYATITLKVAGATGSTTTFASQTTKITGGSGNWTANVAVPIPLSAYAAIANAGITLTIAKAGTGVVVPAGLFYVLYLDSSSKAHADQIMAASTGYYKTPAAGAVTQITAPDSDDSSTPTKTYALIAQIDSVIALHNADTYSHKVADAVARQAVPTTQNLTNAITYLNAVKAKLNTHMLSTTYHYNADGWNFITTADASSTQAQANTLVNAIKASLNAHITNAIQTPQIQVVSP